MQFYDKVLASFTHLIHIMSRSTLPSTLHVVLAVILDRQRKEIVIEVQRMKDNRLV